MKKFYTILVNNMVAGITNMFVWFALTFYIYLETRSVLATSIIAGSWSVLSAVMGLYFGTYVDHHKKKRAMALSSILSAVFYIIGLAVLIFTPERELLTLSSIEFWLFVGFVLAGSVAGNLRNIAMSTCVTLLVPVDKHDRANGLIGSTSGVVFSLTSLFGGLGIGFLGMRWSLIVTIIATALVLVHILTIDFKEEKTVHLSKEERPKRIDIKGALGAIHAVPGLLGLIFFATFNNFLGGVFMSLMDAYGLSLISVEAWGILWAFLSLGIIVGGLIIAKRGLGKNPVRTLFATNIALWVICIFFTIHRSIVLTAIGMLFYMMLMPAVEASEQTIIQKVVPLKKQGRVFGFAQTMEQAASPVTAFLIGPLAQLFFIPTMIDGFGARTIGSWFGTGSDRGIALVFTLAGIIGLIVTVLAMYSRSYRSLVKSYSS
jgi:DHA3 family multidrug efflux protein-like MFS transporter